MNRPAFAQRTRSALRSVLSAFSVLSVLSIAACGTSEKPARVVLPQGASFSAVTDSLKAHGVIGSPRAFKLLARVRGVDRTVHA